MRLKNLHIMLLSLCLLAGCATGENEASRSLSDILRTEKGLSASSPACEAPQDLIGLPNTEIQKRKLKSPVRVLFPGAPAPTDKKPNRLIFKVDKNGIIKSVTCG